MINLCARVDRGVNGGSAKLALDGITARKSGYLRSAGVYTRAAQRCRLLPLDRAKPAAADHAPKHILPQVLRSLHVIGKLTYLRSACDCCGGQAAGLGATWLTASCGFCSAKGAKAAIDQKPGRPERRPCFRADRRQPRVQPDGNLVLARITVRIKFPSLPGPFFSQRHNRVTGRNYGGD